MRRYVPIVALLAAIAPLAHAEGPVLHEFVPEVAAEEGELLLREGGDDEPAGLVYEGEVLPAPEGGEPRSEEPRLSASAGGAAAGQGPSFRPDRLTELEERLGYQAVFSPSITPFKRVTVLDAVALARDRETPVLEVGSEATRVLRVEGAEVPPPDGRPRDRFWGEVVLDFTEGRRVPLPSVSPESRILTVRTEPATALRFERNEAGAFFVVAVGPVPREPVRLVFLTDAPRTYFGTSIPNVAADTLRHEVPSLPPSVRSRGLAFAAELGLAPEEPLPGVLRTLTGHFRAFEESAVPPEDQGDIYLDLARAKKGVCRHRTYAFVITAQALGIPARFVYNEAHSWAEVKMPGVGWMRVDLGGAARGLDAQGAQDRPVHQSREPDPLPRPESYERNYSQLGGEVSGLRGRDGAAGGSGDDSGDEAPASEPGESESASASAPSSAAGARNEEPGGSGRDSARSRSGAPSLVDREAPSAEASEDEAESAPIPLQITVESRRYEAYRGRSLEVAGRVTDDTGQGVSGMRIEILLRRRGERLLGVTVSGDEGWFHGSFGVAPQVPVGDYELVVRTPGDDGYAPAVAH